jgi:hypothetical protein
LVFSRVTAARVFNPELIAGSRVRQPTATNISVGEQRVIDSELQGLGGSSVTAVYSGRNQTVVGVGSVNQVTSAGGSNAQSGSEFQTVFFDVNSGARYIVRNGQIVKPVETSVDVIGGETGGHSETTGQHRVSKSFYISAGGE